MRILFALLAMVVLQAEAANKSWGFSFSSGPGYRQDRLTWESNSNQQVYPHLRMFDWALSFDMAVRQFHVLGAGDFGWFSSQAMRLSDNASFPAPVSFSYVANGRAATGTLSLGYQFGQTAKGFLMPLAGWLYDSADLQCNRPIPPFARIGESTDASIAFTSNPSFVWQGPFLGGRIGWQPLRVLRFVAVYTYGWIHASPSFTQLNSLRTGSALHQNTISQSTGDSGHSQLALFQLFFFLSRKISLDGTFRYISLQGGSSKLSSLTFSAAFDCHF